MVNEWLEYEWFKVKTVGELKESLKLIPDNTKIDALEMRLITNIKLKETFLQHKTPEEY